MGMIMSIGLLEAVLDSNLMEVKRLLSVNKDVNFSDIEYSNNTALHLAVIGKEKDIVGLLMETAGVILDKSNAVGKTPLHYAVSQSNVEIVKQLISNGANSYVKDIFGNIPLFYAVAENVFGKLAPYTDSRNKIVEMLLSNIDTDDTNNIGVVQENGLPGITQNVLNMLSGLFPQEACNYIQACNKLGLLN